MMNEQRERVPGRLNLEVIDEALKTVEVHWQEIDDELEARGIGRKDTPFTETLRARLMSAFGYVEELLEQGVAPFSPESIEPMLMLNERVHYGTDQQLRIEYAGAIAATREKYYQQIGPIRQWYELHSRRGNQPLKKAAEVYVSILGYPQLYVEGNHRTGTLVADWINVYYGYPPFVLSVDNAIAYFAPSAEIKNFAHRSTWRAENQLPKYRKSFLAFWRSHIDERFLVK
jgi:hypothetical protein